MSALAQRLPRCVTFYIGQNAQGLWIVRDSDRRHGGIFKQRNDALRFALSEHRLAAVFLVPGPIELSFDKGGGRSHPASSPPGDAESAMALTGLQRPSR